MFKVIDTTTGECPTEEVIEQIANDNGLCYCDIEGFLLGEDGYLYLADECGKWCYVDMRRFKVEVKE